METRALIAALVVVAIISIVAAGAAVVVMSRHYSDERMREFHMAGTHMHDLVAPEREVEPAPAGEQALKLSGAVVAGVRVITMKARRFEFDPSILVVRRGEEVRLEVTSEDVSHGIDIERLGIDRLLKPGKR